MAYLRVLKGPSPGTRIELQENTCLLGRSPDCSIVLDAGAVSRHHARITFSDGSFLIEDLKSRNKTFVNSKEVESPTALKDNDRIKICDNLLTFHEGLSTEASDLDHRVEFANDDSANIMSTLDASTGTKLLADVRPEVKLGAVLEIVQNLGKALDLDEILPKILDSLFKIFPKADRGIILEDQDDRLVPKAIKSRREGDDDSVRISRTVVRQALEKRQAILSADAFNDSNFNMSQSISDFRIHSIMCVPLLDSSGRKLGVIQLHTEDHRQQFTEEDLEVLVSVANTAAITLDNARIHKELMEKQRLQREMEFARDVQRGFLPAALPKVPGYSFYSFYESAYSVGGDYYGFIELPDGRLGISLGDVSGKGMTAALVMARLSSDVRFSAISAPSAVEVVEWVNSSLSEVAISERFVTFLYMILDPKEHTLSIVNAGHMCPMVRNGQEITETGEEAAGVPLNVIPGYSYESSSVHLDPGAMVLLYTDGVQEAMNPREELFGTDRLIGSYREAPNNPEKAGEQIIEKVRRFAEGFRQSDDIALICFGRNS